MDRKKLQKGSGVGETAEVSDTSCGNGGASNGIFLVGPPPPPTGLGLLAVRLWVTGAAESPAQSGCTEGHAESMNEHMNERRRGPEVRLGGILV